MRFGWPGVVAVVVLFASQAWAASATYVDDPWFGSLTRADIQGPWEFASVVLVSEDMADVTTMFGHVFLVFHRHVDIEPDAVVLEYVGALGGRRPAAMQAVLASVPGAFVFVRYAVKSREYDYHNRSMWVYRLDPTRVSPEDIIARATDEEFSGAYGFFSRNCAGYLFRLITGHTANGLRTVWNTPAQLVADLHAQRFLMGADFRPSRQVRLETARHLLTASQQGAVARCTPIIDAGGRAAVGERLAERPDERLGDDDRLVSAAHQTSAYLLEHAQSVSQRDHIFRYKKSLPPLPYIAASKPKDDPSRRRRTSMVQLLAVAPGGRVELAARAAAYDFYSSVPGPFDLSSLEIGRIVLAARGSRVSIRNLTLADIESHVAYPGRGPSRSRYLSVGFIASNLRARVGVGAAVAASRFVKLGAIVFTGPVMPDFPSHQRFAWELGLRFHAQPAFHTPQRLRLGYELSVLLPVDVLHHLSIAMVVAEWRRYGVFVNAGTRFGRQRDDQIGVGMTAFF